MLSAYIDKHHNDWDKHLPFVMMAYRSTVHKTTCTSQNMMILRQEVETPLDIVNDMPTSIKTIS